jgi:hypothetical protein
VRHRHEELALQAAGPAMVLIDRLRDASSG